MSWVGRGKYFKQNILYRTIQDYNKNEKKNSSMEGGNNNFGMEEIVMPVKYL